MKSLVRKFLWAMLFPLALSGCQSTGGTRNDMDDILEQAAMLESLNMDMGGPARNIPGFMINGWNYVDNENLLVMGGVDEYYLVTFIEPCEELRMAVNIFFEIRGPVINPSDNVIAVPMIGPGQRCPIDQIYEVEPREVEED